MTGLALSFTFATVALVYVIHALGLPDDLLRKLAIAGLIGFGAAGQGSHAPGETVELTSFDRQIKRAALLMTRLAQTKR